MDATDLGRWTRFAAKGGIGKCTALQDCVAQGNDDLMFLANDEITVLMQLPEDDLYLGYCEGVVGHFHGKDVRFHGKLKKPVIQKRSSTSTSSVKSISPIPTPTLKVDFDHLDQYTSRMSLPALPKPTRASTPGTEVKEPSFSSRPSFIVTSSPPHSVPEAESSKRKAGRIDGAISSLPKGTPAPPEESRRLSRTEPHFLKPPSTVALQLPPKIEIQPKVLPETEPTPSPVTSRDPVLDSTHTLRPPSASVKHESSFSTSLNESVISVSLDDDGETGIGLRLLAGLSGEEDEDEDGSVLEHDKTVTIPSQAPTETQDSDSVPTSPKSIYSQVQSQPHSPERSLYDESMDAENEWDGAADIYDDYRYSRYSFKSSRTSTPRGVPNDRERKDSNASSRYDRRRSTATVASLALPDSSRPSVESETLVFPMPPPTEPLHIIRKQQKQNNIPPPLTSLQKRPSSPTSSRHLSTGPSPLLHTTFASPTASAHSSASQVSSMHPTPSSPRIQVPSPLLSPRLLDESGFGLASTSPLQAGGGFATALRAKLEADRKNSKEAEISPPVEEPYDESVVFDGTHFSREGDTSRDIVESASGNESQVADSTLASDVSKAEADSTEDDSSQFATDVRQSPAVMRSPPPLSSTELTRSNLSANPLDPPTPRSPAPAFPPSPSVFQGVSTPPVDVTQLPTSQPGPFLPHPFAPKARQETSSTIPAGPSILRLATMTPVGSGNPPAPHGTFPASTSLVHTLREAALSYHRPSNANQLRRAATIHGQVEQDLASSNAPVPIAWVVDGWREREVDKSPVQQSKPSPHSGKPIEKGDSTLVRAATQGSHSKQIPRPNFTPTVGMPRPRSRSFSDLDEISLGADRNQASLAPSPPSSTETPNQISLQTSLAPNRNPQTSRSPPLIPAPPSGQPNRITSPRTIPLAPSPLGLSIDSPTSTPLSGASKSEYTIRSPASPTPPHRPSSRAASPAGRLSSNGASASRRSGLRHFASSITLRTPERPSVSGTDSSSSTSQVPIRRNSGPTAPHDTRNSPQTTILHPAARRVSQRSQSDAAERQASIETTRSTELSHYSDSVQQHSPSSGNNITSPSTSPVGQTPSLRTKLSISHLRGKSGSKGQKESPPEPSITSRTPSSSAPPTPSAQVEFEEETVQVKDMEFELVRPIIRHRDHQDSEDSGPDSKDMLSIRNELRREAESFRSQSPAVSTHVAPDGRSPAASSVDSFPNIKSKRGAVDPSSTVEANREAHRARELKWLSTMPQVPPASKSKKIRKLLQEPVPDSVRYLVWTHLIDAKAKRIDGVYDQMGKRPRTTITDQIEKDAERCFPQQPHLRDPKGPLVSVVGAYLAMVPDIRYSTGLTVVAGHLLLQSPEEDAFWILLALMDIYMRPFYSPLGSQLEADSALFSKAVESNDPHIAKRLFVDLAIRPIDLCRVWFPYLFAGTVPNSHLHRIWDLFFYEGPVLLYRIAIAVLQVCRRNIFDSSHSSPQTIVSLLLRPHPELFPDPETFLSQALSSKLKDDDIRKQRLKAEVSLRQQPQRSASHAAAASRLRSS